MNAEAVERIANAILYEGYLLYPYRRSSLKNRRRWDFGLVYPPGREDDNEPSCLQAEYLAESSADTSVEIHLRFLHALTRREGAEEWQEAVPRRVEVPPVPLAQAASHPLRHEFRFLAASTPGQEPLEGVLEFSAEQLQKRLYRCSLRVSNTADAEGEPVPKRLARTLASTHAIFQIAQGEFVSLLEPPECYTGEAAGCRNVGLWPVLAGESPGRTMMLASPIILYDYPEVAPESVGDLFDATEIDELLTLRILTLTDDEKRQIRVGDSRGREILERSESMNAEGLQRLHGSIREIRRKEEDA